MRHLPHRADSVHLKWFVFFSITQFDCDCYGNIYLLRIEEFFCSLFCVIFVVVFWVFSIFIKKTPTHTRSFRGCCCCGFYCVCCTLTGLSGVYLSRLQRHWNTQIVYTHFSIARNNIPIVIYSPNISVSLLLVTKLIIILLLSFFFFALVSSHFFVFYYFWFQTQFY